MRLLRPVLWGSAFGGAVYWLLRYFRPRHSTLVLNEKVVIITGASSGIGRALAFAFARRAAKVVLVARRADRLEAVRREIEPYISDVLVIPADVTDDTQLQHVVQRTLETFGQIDILVNNAGLMCGGLLQDQPPDRIEQILAVNLGAVIRLTQLVLPHMLANHQGYIMNVGSGLGRTAMPTFAPYVASKYGLSGFSDALRRELAKTGVYVTLVLPGWTHTEMIPVEVEDLLERYGYHIEHPDDAAERAVLGLVRGQHEVILGGLFSWIGIMTERYVPFLVWLYWRLWLTPEWIATMSKIR
ncbi:MAG: SDR family NAD(P)-dependent oxidoreductase [Chloroflexi bacterium]|nr:SDR family NAD(P)-dependent oxidoreductase [Chloroflexota bacterium]